MQINNKEKILQNNTLLISACFIAIIVILALLLFPAKESSVTYGKFTPPPFENAAENGQPNVPEELGWSVLQITEETTASVCGVLNEENGDVEVWFYNHSTNSNWLKLRLLDMEGNILGETGLLKPNEYVQHLHLDTLPNEDTDVILHVMGYTPETYYSAGSIDLQTTLNLSE